MQGKNVLTKKEILALIQKNLEILKCYGIKKIGVFGSFTHSSQRNMSDVDILVELEHGKKLLIII